MRKFILAGVVAATAASAVAFAVSRAEAATFGPAAGLGIAAEAVDVSEPAQYYYAGRRYCWYPDGWRGPGWYWCGYSWRHGFGWGGRGPGPAMHRGGGGPRHR